MKIKLLILLIFQTFFLFPQSIYASTTQSVNLFRLTFTEQQERGPLVHDSTVVWLYSDGFHAYNMETQTDNIIYYNDAAVFPGAYNNKYLIYDKYLGDNDSRENDIYAVDLTTGEDYEVVGGDGTQDAGDIYEDKLVYTDVYYHGFGFGDLYIYDLKKKTNTFITNNAAVPRIWKNYVVWYSRVGSGIYDIHAYNLATEKFIEIPNPDNSNRFYPSIYNNHLIYNQSNGTTSSIRLYDLNNKKEQILTQSSTIRFGTPDIYKDYAVWDKSPSQHIAGIDGMNLKTGEIFEIFPVGDQMNTRMPLTIYNNIVSWHSFRTGNGDIYSAIISKH